MILWHQNQDATLIVLLSPPFHPADKTTRGWLADPPDSGQLGVRHPACAILAVAQWSARRGPLILHFATWKWYPPASCRMSATSRKGFPRQRSGSREDETRQQDTTQAGGAQSRRRHRQVDGLPGQIGSRSPTG
jgi:hypothetical protein